ncbi:MAG: amidase [Gammaproteobacteria bacterium]|nr:amidase [Gammaproteobacteria bacterium]
MTDTQELCLKTATELRCLIDDKTISAVELLNAHLEQIEATNPTVNAIVTLAPEHALAMAKNVDAQIARGGKTGLLAGLPVAHKDLHNTKGIRTTYGSRIYKDHVPDENALIVQRIIDAGAVTLGKTNTPEWGAGSQTFNEVFGATKNPYDTSKTCGGSSGGAAVALAKGMVPIADGSDMGGSLRNPASFCNVVGFRPSPGRVPTYPSLSAWFSIPVVGPMARTVEDCTLLLAAIAGPDPRVPISIDEPGTNFLNSLQREFKGVKIALSPDFDGQVPVAKSVQKVVTDSSSVFDAIGCKVEAACPDFSGADFAFKTLRAWSFAAKHEENIEKYRELYKESIIWNAEQGMKLKGEDIHKAESERTSLFRRVVHMMREYEFLVLPVSQVAPFDITEEYVKEIEGQKMHTYIDWMQSCYFISCTGLPAISVPYGFTPEGLPVGIQIVGRHHQDFSVLQLAYAFQQANTNVM